MRNRIITARIKFKPRAFGRNLNEAGLSEELSRALEFCEHFNLDTTLDGDPLNVRKPPALPALSPREAAMLAALKAAECWMAAELNGRLEVEPLAKVRAAIAGAPADPVRDAAPNILAALKGLTADVERHGLWSLDPGGRPIVNTVPKGLDYSAGGPTSLMEAHAAIAQAEGR